MKRYFVSVVAVAVLLSLALPAAAQGLQNVELHGYLENRFYANPNTSARFIAFRISLSAVAQVGKDGTAYTEVYFHPNTNSSVYLESAYLDLPLSEGRIRIGKGRQLNFGLTPAYGNRKLIQYGILAETFTMDRIQGFQYAYKKGAFDFGASLFTDLRVGQRLAGNFPGGGAVTVPYFADRDIVGSASGELAGSVKVGVTTPCFQAHVSGQTGGLRQNDADFIGWPYGFAPGANTNRDHNQYGVDATYTSGPFIAQGEWYQGNFSFLKVSGFSILAGYQPKDKTRAYVRYAALDNNRAVVPAQPLTWDKQQLTFGVVQPIREGVWVEFQYEKNWESTGGAPNVNNDLLFVEFFTGF